MTRVRVAVGAVALTSSLLLARVHPFGDAGLYPRTYSPPQIMEYSSVPSPVRDLLIAKCADCHSTQPHAPFYGRLAPISWLMEHDIVEGREHMNLSRWDAYTPDEQQIFRAKILQQARTGKMPLPEYRNIHRSSQITKTDLAILSEWAHLSSTLPTGSSLSTSTDGDAMLGQQIFEKRCTGCHSLDKNREGPRLRGVFGRTSGQIPGFPYSSALKNAHIIWNEQTLDRWLADPDAYIPNNNMDFAVIKQQERQSLIRFLKEEGIR